MKLQGSDSPPYKSDQTVLELTIHNSECECDIPIVCLTRVWQPLFPFFCDKAFKFAIQTWHTS